MSVWYTTPPTSQDLPIWAYIGDNVFDVVLIRSEFELPDDCEITWCKANIPVPAPDVAYQQFKELMLEDHTVDWTSFDWYKAGYDKAREMYNVTTNISDSNARVCTSTNETITGTQNMVSYKF